MSYAQHVRPVFAEQQIHPMSTLSEKQALHAKIESEVEEFLARGGSIVSNCGPSFKTVNYDQQRHQALRHLVSLEQMMTTYGVSTALLQSISGREGFPLGYVRRSQIYFNRKQLNAFLMIHTRMVSNTRQAIPLEEMDQITA